MPFDASLPDEIAPGEATAFRCKYLSSVLARRCRLVYDHPGIHKFELTFKEPPGSASSSPDEDCATCGHWRDSHNTVGDHCNVCHTIDSASRHCIHDFTPAEPEAPTAAQDAAMDELIDLRQEMEATEPEQCLTRFDGDLQCAGTRRHPGDCTPNADDIALPEPEAPEEPGPTELAPCAICGDRRKTNEFKAGLLLCEPCIYSEGQPYCGACGSKEAPFGLVSHEGEDRFNELRCAKCLLPPRRPPYAVAYTLADGERYEVALPGDATIRAVEGALLITHASAVLALTQARPMEG